MKDKYKKYHKIMHWSSNVEARRLVLNAITGMLPAMWIFCAEATFFFFVCTHKLNIADT
jgi:hypothetical protein